MILVFGQNGQLARAFQQVLPSESIFLSSSKANFALPESLKEILDHYQPSIIINCAAYTHVDMAESEKDLCQKVNAEAPAQIAKWCEANLRIMVHFSTDYVFAGNGEAAWTESDLKNPNSFYGKTKALGDELIERNLVRHLIFRISWVYDETGKNFVNTMLKIGTERTQLQVVSDQIGYPAYAYDIAEFVAQLLPQIQQPHFQGWGTYHLAGEDVTSWHQFATEIFRVAKSLGAPLRIENVIPIKSSDYPTKAVRPLNSKLNFQKLKLTFGKTLPNWQSSLEKCLRRKYADH